MKVLLVLGWPLTFGGHISSTYALAREMQRHDLEVHTSSPNGPMVEAFVSAGLPFSPCNSLLKVSPWHLVAFLRLVLTAKKCGAQLIHAMDYKALYPSYLAAAFIGVPLFYTKAGGVVPSYRIPEVSRLIVFSEELREGMGDSYPAISGRMVLIKERLDTNLFSPKETLTKADDNRLRLFMAMRFEEGKRTWLESAFKGVRKLAEKNIPFEFTLAGDGPLRDELIPKASAIEKCFSNAEFHFPGMITNPDAMVQYYRAADIVIGHGRGVLEAMACGKPVVVIGSESGATLVEPATVAAICEYNFSGRHLGAYPKMACDLVDIILALNRDSGLRSELGEFSRQYIEKEYSIEVGARKLVELYRNEIRQGFVNTRFSSITWLLRSALFRSHLEKL